MTREEAIQFIGQSVKNDVDMSKIADALKALKQEPCEDAISREAVQDLIATWLSDYLTYETREVLETIDYKIGDMPSVYPKQEPKQVELEGDGYAYGTDEIVYDFGKCPTCGWEFEEGDKDWGEPYCCHCGQKLEWFDDETERNDEK